eukprot:5582834-Prymnesium_polylepis.1
MPDTSLIATWLLPDCCLIAAWYLRGGEHRLAAGERRAETPEIAIPGGHVASWPRGLFRAARGATKVTPHPK